MRRLLPVFFNLVFVFTLCSASAYAQTAQPAKPVAKAPAVAKASPNDDIVKLTMAGMGEDIILGVVAKTDKSTYDTSVDALLKLKSAGVSPKVIAAILGVSPPAPTAPSAPAQPAAGSVILNVPSTQHVGVTLDSPSTTSLDGREAGIYLQKDSELEQLEPTVYSGQKTGGVFKSALTGGLASASIKAVIRSAKANQRVQVSTPTFLFFFETKGAGLSNTGTVMGSIMSSASSPNEFVLVRMKGTSDEREVIIGQRSAFSARSGVPSKDTVDFVVKKLRSGVYEVTTRTPLTAGEYCFYYAGGTTNQGGTGKLFDFGVDAGAVAK